VTRYTDFRKRVKQRGRQTGGCQREEQGARERPGAVKGAPVLRGEANP